MIRIYTFAHRRPDFIALQLGSFQRHLREDFRLTVFNNAVFDKDDADRRGVEAECLRLGVDCVPVEYDHDLVGRMQAIEGRVRLFTGGEYTNGNIACAYPLCWAWSHVIAPAGGKACVIDSDMFLLEPTVLSDFLVEQPLCYVPMHRKGGIEYMWNGLLLLDVTALPDVEKIMWWCGSVNGQSVDVGGQTHHWLVAHPDVKRKYIRPERVDDERQKGHELLWLDDRPILHYLRGSDFMHFTAEERASKTEWLRRTLR